MQVHVGKDTVFKHVAKDVYNDMYNKILRNSTGLKTKKTTTATMSRRREKNTVSAVTSVGNGGDGA